VIPINNRDMALALIAIACGGFALLAATGVMPMETANNTPAWIVGLAGLVFVIGGAMLFLRNHSRALDLLASIILASFALIAAWIAIYGSADGFSGGISILSGDAKVSLARIMFGIGAIMCFAGFLYAMRRYFQSIK